MKKSLILWTVLAPLLARSATAQTVNQAIRQNAGRSHAQSDEGPVQIPAVNLRLNLKEGDELTYDVTIEYRRNHEGGGGYSIVLHSAVLVFTVEEERDGGFVLSWPDVVMGDRYDVLAGGRTFISKTGRFEVPQDPVSDVVSLFLIPMTLPPAGRDPQDEFKVVFRNGSTVNARANGKVYAMDWRNNQAKIALYGRNVHIFKDFEFHSVFDWELGLIVRSTYLDLARDVRSYMEFKSIRHAGG